MSETAMNAAESVKSLEWCKGFELGIPALDLQHKGLFDLCQTLCYSSGELPPEAQSAIVDKLLRYAMDHFTDEETLLEKAMYQGRLGHAALHEKFFLKAHEIRRQLRQDPSRTDAIRTFVLDWLTHHILEEDQKFVAHLRMQGLI